MRRESSASAPPRSFGLRLGARACSDSATTGATISICVLISTSSCVVKTGILDEETGRFAHTIRIRIICFRQRHVSETLRSPAHSRPFFGPPCK
ncbi:hypothetical protein L596_019945 [Steinernema carpocapsae]|uniref:Uncharacterized protein n=1 Tax=Steinernema carpocapsae TaxID=34508 RepID=A0A4U5MS43_STECR|nr:hypothetical protein L596_019945 [Steinernema carpocapsae]